MATVIVSDDEEQCEIAPEIVKNTATDISVEMLFSCGVYRSHDEKYLDIVNSVFKREIAARKKEVPDFLKSVYPTIMTRDLAGEPKLEEFTNYIARTAWEVLNSQGYAMDRYTTHFFDCFGQEHHKYSGHDTHTHPGAYITGFYFLDVPKDSCRPVFQDPKAAKYHSSLLEKNPSIATLASNEINYQPVAGDFFFTNSWLPHSFTRNAANKPMKFIHFSLGVSYKSPVITPDTPAVTI